MRILHFIKGLGRGGAEVLLVHALRHADRGRFNFEYAYMLPHKDALVAELTALGAPVHLVAGRSKAQLATATQRLTRLVRERDIDIIHAHLPVAGMVARFAGAWTRTPVLYTEHNLNSHYGRLTRWGNRVTWRLNTACAAVSQPVADSIAEVMPASARVPVHTVPNGIDVDQFLSLPGGDEIRCRLGIPADAGVVINVAVFRQQKRLDLWLQTARDVAAAVSSTHFILVGDGPLRGDVESWRSEMGLADRVHLVGLQDDVKPFLSAADLFLLTSDFEGLPLAVIEGMASGLPVVATRAGGVPDLVGESGEGAGGVLVELGDVAGCVAGVVGLLTDDARLRSTGETARARVRRDFGVERMVAQYQDMYEAMRGSRRGPSTTA
jgi:glycosyltransferase involved in cell wall biosynthesis